MASEKPEAQPEEEKKDKPVVKKVMGRAGITPSHDAEKHGPPSYEHG